MQAMKTATISKAESLVFMKNILRISLSSICFHRKLFPEKCFRARQYGTVEIHQLTAAQRDESTGELQVENEEAFTVTQWLEGGVFDALEAGWLAGVVFAIYASHPDTGSDVLIESYNFNVKYGDEESNNIMEDREEEQEGESDMENDTKKGNRQMRMKHTQKKTKRPQKSTRQVTTMPSNVDATELVSKEAVKNQAAKFIRSLSEFVSTLEDIPSDRWLSVELQFRPGTPSEFTVSASGFRWQQASVAKRFLATEKHRLGGIATHSVDVTACFHGLDGPMPRGTNLGHFHTLRVAAVSAQEKERQESAKGKLSAENDKMQMEEQVVSPNPDEAQLPKLTDKQRKRPASPISKTPLTSRRRLTPATVHGGLLVGKSFATKDAMSASRDGDSPCSNTSSLYASSRDLNNRNIGNEVEVSSVESTTSKTEVEPVGSTPDSNSSRRFFRRKISKVNSVKDEISPSDVQEDEEPPKTSQRGKKRKLNSSNTNKISSDPLPDTSPISRPRTRNRRNEVSPVVPTTPETKSKIPPRTPSPPRRNLRSKRVNTATESHNFSNSIEHSKNIPSKASSAAAAVVQHSPIMSPLIGKSSPPTDMSAMHESTPISDKSMAVTPNNGSSRGSQKSPPASGTVANSRSAVPYTDHQLRLVARWTITRHRPSPVACAEELKVSRAVVDAIFARLVADGRLEYRAKMWRTVVFTDLPSAPSSKTPEQAATPKTSKGKISNTVSPEQIQTPATKPLLPRRSFTMSDSEDCNLKTREIMWGTQESVFSPTVEDTRVKLSIIRDPLHLKGITKL